MKFKRTRYTDVVNGKWFRFEISNGLRVRCCDCGLTDDYDMRKRDNGTLEMRIQNVESATKAARRSAATRLSIANLRRNLGG